MYLSSLTREKAAGAAITTEEAAQGHSRKQVVRSGLFLYDERVLSAMDDTSDRSFIGVKKTKNKETGELEYNAKARKKLLTQEEFDTLLADMGQLLTDIAMRIKGGDATAAPMKESGQHSTCNSCPHKAICRHVSRPTEKSETEGDEG